MNPLRRYFSNALALLISFGIALPQTGLAAVGIRRGESYLSCLSRLGMGPDVERQLLEGVKTKGQMLQLLYDYGFVLSDGFKNALSKVLAGQEITFDHTKYHYGPGADRYSNKWLTEKSEMNVRMGYDLKRYVLQLRALVQLPDDQFRLFIDSVVQQFVNRRATSYGSDEFRQIRFTQANNLIDNVKGSGKEEMFYEIMGQAIRESLLVTARQGANALAERWRPKNDWVTLTRALLTVVGGGAAWILFPQWIMSPSEIHYRPDDAACMGIIGFFGGLTVVDWLGRNMIPHPKPRKIVLPTDEIATYQLDDAESHWDGIAVKSMWEEMTTEVSTGVLSVGQACRDGICSLSPVDLAYLGHIDILELQRMRLAVNRIVQGGFSGDLLQTLRRVAREIIQQPLDQQAHAELAAALKTLDENVLPTAKESSATINSLKAKVAAVRDAMDKLIKMPNSKKAKQAQGEDAERYRILESRLNGDLAMLRSLSFDAEMVEQRAGVVRTARERLTAISTKPPTTSDEWSQAADEILSIVGSLK